VHNIVNPQKKNTELSSYYFFFREDHFIGFDEKLVMEFVLTMFLGSMGKKRGVKNYASVYIPVVEYLCEVRATKCVMTIVDICNNTDDIEAMYLPTHMSICSCYMSYLNRLATPSLYSMTLNTELDNGLERMWTRHHHMFHFLSITMFYYNVWKCDFWHIKIRNLTKHVCALCFQIMNRHKYSIGMSTHSLADNSSSLMPLKMKSPGLNTKVSPATKNN